MTHYYLVPGGLEMQMSSQAQQFVNFGALILTSSGKSLMTAAVLYETDNGPEERAPFGTRMRVLSHGFMAGSSVTTGWSMTMGKGVHAWTWKIMNWS